LAGRGFGLALNIGRERPASTQEPLGARASQSARLDTPAAFCDPPSPSEPGRRRKVMADPHAPPRRRLSLVIPAYNEEAGIRQAVAEADEALARLTPAYEILVVDDGSADGTAAAVAEEARARPAVRLLRHPTNRGYGAALRTGFEAARFECVAFTDA